jgi:putative tricarboxylic transport membrane protein
VYALDAVPAIIMVAGIYYGAQYGGSTTAILINVPGESSSVVTAIDGYQMARQGRAGAALAVAGLGSFFAGCVGTVAIAAFGPPLAGLALKFGPTGYFSLMVLGLVGAVVLASGSLIKAVAMIVLGLLLSMVSADEMTGLARYSFGVPELSDGIGVVVVAMGLFGFGEIIANLGQKPEHREVFTKDVKGLWPTRQDFKDSWPAVLRGTALGSILGVLPGGGALLASFAAYSVEKKVAGKSGNFGKGDIRGVAGPESANNAGAQTSFIPVLTLGIPTNAVMALIVSVLTIKGFQPGPEVMTKSPQLFWGLVASMWVGNAMLIILNLPLIGIWIKLLTVPYRYLFPAITLFCCIGVYTLNGSNFDVYLTALFAFLGYVFYKLKCEPAPLLLGFILGQVMEGHLGRALRISRGEWSTFVTNPLSLGLLLVAAVLLVIVLLPSISAKRKEAFQDAD